MKFLQKISDYQNRISFPVVLLVVWFALCCVGTEDTLSPTFTYPAAKTNWLWEYHGMSHASYWHNQAWFATARVRVNMMQGYREIFFSAK